MNNLLQTIIPMPMPINTNGGGFSNELIIALFIVCGNFVFLLSLIWLAVDYIKMKRKYRRCFSDWWRLDADFFPQGCVVCYLLLAAIFLMVELAYKIVPLL